MSGHGHKHANNIIIKYSHHNESSQVYREKFKNEQSKYGWWYKKVHKQK